MDTDHMRCYQRQRRITVKYDKSSIIERSANKPTPAMKTEAHDRSTKENRNIQRKTYKVSERVRARAANNKVNTQSQI